MVLYTLLRTLRVRRSKEEECRGMPRKKRRRMEENGGEWRRMEENGGKTEEKEEENGGGEERRPREKGRGYLMDMKSSI
jgi:hypothetical protein